MRAVPLFPGYLFLRLAEGLQALAPVRSSVGVLGVVRFGSCYAVVPDHIIEDLRSRADPATGFHRLTLARSLEAGASVRIAAGPFDGVGRYLCPRRRCRTCGRLAAASRKGNACSRARGRRASKMATTLAARQIPRSRAEPTGVDERLDLVALWNLFSEYRWTILATAVVFGALATTYAMLATPIFRAEVTVTLVKDQSNGGAGGLASQLGDIASLAGVNLGDTSGEEEAYRAVLASRHLIERLHRAVRIAAGFAGKRQTTADVVEGDQLVP